jgi:hypothetical protein
MGRILIGLVALITMGAAAPAAAGNTVTLAAGGLFGGSTQTGALCYLYNAGVNSVTVTNVQIIEEPNIVLPQDGNNCCTGTPCSGILAGGNICFFAAAPISSGVAHSCSAAVTGLLPGAPYIRGTLEIRTGPSDATLLASEPMR